jgi:hypothetical protein
LLTKILVYMEQLKAQTRMRDWNSLLEEVEATPRSPLRPQLVIRALSAPSNRPAVGRLNGLGHQLTERAYVRRHDGQCAGERSEPDDVDPDQSPDQRIDAAQSRFRS